MRFTAEGAKGYILKRIEEERAFVYEVGNKGSVAVMRFLRDMSEEDFAVFEKLTEEEQEKIISEKLSSVGIDEQTIKERQAVDRLYKKATATLKDYIKRCIGKSTPQETAEVLNTIMRELLVTRELRVIQQHGDDLATVYNLIDADTADGILGTHIDQVKKDPAVYTAMIAEWEAIFAEGEKTQDEWDGTIMSLFWDDEDYADGMHKWILKKKKQIPRASVPAAKAEAVTIPVDKVNSNVWGQHKTITEIMSQLDHDSIQLDTNRNNGNFITYNISFNLPDNMSLSKELTPYDERVYEAAGALWDNLPDVIIDEKPAKVITATQIYATMGNTGRPNANDLKKINDSLTKMMTTRLHLDTSNDRPGKVVDYRYDSWLLQADRVTALVDGQVVNSAIRILSEPALLKLAKDNKEVTTVPVKMLQSPISQTEDNLLLEDYLIREIAHRKNGKMRKGNRILFENLYKKTGMESKMQKSRGREKVSALLEHYKSEKWIDDFEIDTEGITVKFTK